MASLKTKIKFAVEQFIYNHDLLGCILYCLHLFLQRIICLFKGHKLEVYCIVQRDEKGEYLTVWCSRCGKEWKKRIKTLTVETLQLT